MKKNNNTEVIRKTKLFEHDNMAVNLRIVRKNVCKLDEIPVSINLHRTILFSFVTCLLFLILPPPPKMQYLLQWSQ
jgi:hypothetical protein